MYRRPVPSGHSTENESAPLLLANRTAISSTSLPSPILETSSTVRINPDSDLLEGLPFGFNSLHSEDESRENLSIMNRTLSFIFVLSFLSLGVLSFIPSLVTYINLAPTNLNLNWVTAWGETTIYIMVRSSFSYA